MNRTSIINSLLAAIIVVTMLVVVKASSLEEDSCIVEREIETRRTMTIGDPASPSPILIIDNFLPEELASSTFDKIALQEWRTGIPDHQIFYEKYNREEDGRLLRTPQIINGGGFPGLRTSLTQDYEAAILEKLQSLNLEETFETGPLNLEWNEDSFFGNVCYDPSSLGVSQRAPHVDLGFIDKKKVKLAIIHYISPNFPATGGTSFYKETASGGSRFLHRDCKMLKDQAKEKGLKPGTTAHIEAASCHCRVNNMDCAAYQWYGEKVPEPRYTSASSPQYELLHHVPYRFNTVVIYDTHQLHSAFIDDETLQSLSCNASEGRVTANLFIV